MIKDRKIFPLNTVKKRKFSFIMRRRQFSLFFIYFICDRTLFFVSGFSYSFYCALEEIMSLDWLLDYTSRK